MQIWTKYHVQAKELTPKSEAATNDDWDEIFVFFNHESLLFIWDADVTNPQLTTSQEEIIEMLLKVFQKTMNKS